MARSLAMSSMRRSLGVILVVAAAVGVARSDEDKDLRAVIARAVKAKGSEANEAKFKGMEMKGAGTFYGLGEGIPFTGEWHILGHTKIHWTLEIKVMDQMLTITHVINGDKGWQKINDAVMPLPDAELAEEKADLYAKWVGSLTPLKDMAFKLASVGEVKVGDRPATGIRVSHAGQRDINLFFDNANHQLVKSEFQVKDAKGGGDAEMSQETYYSNFKKANGIQFATKVNIKRDGKQYVDIEMSEMRPVENVDESLFAQP
jgi:hypothetical protein